MNRVWLKQYPPGVPTDIDPDEYPSLREMFAEACAAYQNRPAFSNFGAILTYAQLDALSRAFAAWLQCKSGLVAGDRVALMMPNLLQYPIALFGTLRAGMAVVNVNPLYTARELEHQLKDSGAKAIVIVENFCHVLQQVLPSTGLKNVLVTTVGELLGWPRGMLVNFVLRYVRKQIPAWSMPGAIRFKSALSSGLGLKLESVPLGPQDIAFLQYTGGTTGVAKAAVLTHRNMVANMLQASTWIKPALEPGPQRTIITALPLYHIFSLTANCLLFLRLGAKNVLITNPRDFPAFVRELKKHKFFFISGVNTLFNALLHTPGFGTLDFSALRISLGGGMAVQAVVAARWKQVTGNILTQAWGLTETSPAACINPIGVDFNGSVGLPIPSTDISIRDDAGMEMADQRSGRDLRVRASAHARLLEPARRNREGDVRRLAADRRHRAHGRQGLRVHRGSQEGHDPGIGVQRLSERDRERRRGASGRAGGRRGRATRREFRRDGRAVRGEERPHAHGGSADRILPRESHGLQGPETRVLSQRAAEDQRGQDPAPGTAR